MTEKQTEQDLRHQYVAGYLEEKQVPQRYGDRYEDYLRLIIQRVDYIDLPVSKRSKDPFILQDTEREAKRLGFTSLEIVGMRTRTTLLYEGWLAHKHILQSQALVGRRFEVRGGQDPHVYLGDSSHPHGLGYIQSQRE